MGFQRKNAMHCCATQCTLCNAMHAQNIFFSISPVECPAYISLVMAIPFFFYATRWVFHSLILSREGLILTRSILPCPQGWISWSIPVDEMMMRRMSVLHQNSGGIGKSIPSALKISLDPRDFPRASPSGNLSGLGKSLGRRGWISQFLPRLGGARTQWSSFFLFKTIESKHINY